MTEKTFEYDLLNKIAKHSYERESAALPSALFPDKWKDLKKKDKALQRELTAHFLLGLVDTISEHSEPNWTFTLDDLIGDFEQIAAEGIR